MTPSLDNPGDGGVRQHTSWALTVLADVPSRTILTALGATRGRSLSARALTDRFPPDTTPRLVRDRVRVLIRSGLVALREPGAADPPGTQARWRLTPAGEELVSLHALMTRIASNGAALDAGAPSDLRERVIAATLRSLADPVVVEILRCLAERGPLVPDALEAFCHPIPRRTLYRRLDQAVKGGAILRETTRRVPRSTVYSLADQWRPAGAILLLAAWWEARHADLVGTATNFDFEALLLGIQPTIRIPVGRLVGTLEIVVEDGGRGSRPTLFLDDSGVHVASGGDGDRATPDVRDGVATRATGTVNAWTAAIVNDRREGLLVTGDQAFAAGTLTALRTALLSYIR